MAVLDPSQTLALFDLRCRVRREVAEAMVFLEGGSPPSGTARELSRQYLDSLDSFCALREVEFQARHITQQLQNGRRGRLPLLASSPYATVLS